MTIQNRIRTLVCIFMLFGAFVVFAPSGGEKIAETNSDTEESSTDLEQSDGESAPDLNWHREPEDNVVANQDEIRPFFFDTPGNMNRGITGSEASVTRSRNVRKNQDILPFRNVGPVSASRNMVPVEREPQEDDFDDIDWVTHDVVSGDTLQNISTRYYGTPDRYLELYEFNRVLLDSPINLPLGTQIRIPTE